MSIEQLFKAKEYICLHYSDELRLEDLARQAYMAPSTFSRNFKTVIGRNLRHYIIDVRMTHAEQMLLKTNLEIKDICYQSGFETLTNFNRLFKKRNGCTPTEYRQKHKIINNKQKLL